MDQMTIYLILAGVFGLFMAWGIGCLLYTSDAADEVVPV